MSETIIVALIAFVGMTVGTIGGIITSGKLTTYRIEELEKRLEKQNVLLEKIPILEEQISFIKDRLDDLEKENDNDREC